MDVWIVRWMYNCQAYIQYVNYLYAIWYLQFTAVDLCLIYKYLNNDPSYEFIDEVFLKINIV
jgi:hypothetical protein